MIWCYRLSWFVCNCERANHAYIFMFVCTYRQAAIIRIFTKPYDNGDDDDDGTKFISARIEHWILRFYFLLTPPSAPRLLHFHFHFLFFCFIASFLHAVDFVYTHMSSSFPARNEQGGRKYNAIKVIKPVYCVLYCLMLAQYFFGLLFWWKLRRVKKTLDYQAMLIFVYNSIKTCITLDIIIPVQSIRIEEEEEEKE